MFSGSASSSAPRKARVRQQIGHSQFVLVLAQLVVHLPERALIGGGLRGPVPPARREDARLAAAGAAIRSGCPRSRGAARARGLRPAAVRALEVAVLDHGHPRASSGPWMSSDSGSRPLTRGRGRLCAARAGRQYSAAATAARWCGTAAPSRQPRRRGRQGCRLWPPRTVRRPRPEVRARGHPPSVTRRLGRDGTR